MTDLPGITRFPPNRQRAGDMDDFQKFGEDLRTRMWKTAGARYLAAQRLTRRDRFSTFSIALLSVIAIGVGLLDPHVSAGFQRAGIGPAAITAVLSIFILAISLLEGGGQVLVQANKLHENAVRISEVRTEVEVLLAQAKRKNIESWDELSALRRKYEAELRECQFNHESIDYACFEANRRHSPEFRGTGTRPRMNFFIALWNKSHYYASAAWLSVVSWLVVAVLLVFSFDWSLLLCR